jgi:hypothetical protein
MIGFYIGVVLTYQYERKIITRGKIYDLFDLFSSKADNYDADGVIKVIDINTSRFEKYNYISIIMKWYNNMK